MTERRYSKTYIKNWRDKRGLSLRQLANRLEAEPGGESLISHASIGRIENGQQPYSDDYIKQAIALA